MAVMSTHHPNPPPTDLTSNLTEPALEAEVRLHGAEASEPASEGVRVAPFYEHFIEFVFVLLSPPYTQLMDSPKTVLDSPELPAEPSFLTGALATGCPLIEQKYLCIAAVLGPPC